MKCYKCGCELDPFDASCPRCARQKSPTGTRPLRDGDTRPLVQLNQCAHCKMLLFPNDTYCPSCGAPTARNTKFPKAPATKTAPAKKRGIKRRLDRQRVWANFSFTVLAVGATILLLVYFVHLLRG